MLFPEKPQSRAMERREDLRWVPPGAHAIKINVDDAFKKESGKGAVGVIVRNQEGQPLLA
jgi:hypothetical protein